MDESLAQVETDESRAILELLHTYPISQRQERILRLIASRYYRNGYCFAKHETLASAIRCAKSTLQSDMDELEARGLITVTRRQRTSNVTFLAPGLVEALRIQRIERKRMKYTKDLGFASVLTFARSMCNQATEVLESIASLTHEVRPLKISEKTQKPSTFDLDNRPKAVIQPTPVTPPSNNLEISNSSSSATMTGCDASTIVEILRKEGVTARRARELFEIFGHERIIRNLELGLHRSAKNPGGYLAIAISENYAAARPRPGSEAEAVRARESASKHVNKPIVTVPRQQVKPPAIESPTAALDRLPDAQRITLEAEAKVAILAAPPIWLKGMIERYGLGHAAIHGAIKARANAMLTALNTQPEASC